MKTASTRFEIVHHATREGKVLRLKFKQTRFGTRLTCHGFPTIMFQINPENKTRELVTAEAENFPFPVAASTEQKCIQRALKNIWGVV